MSDVRSVALYLPQFHPIPENDGWWGPGFTEWTNLARARPLFRGHEQPKIPGQLGFYDLRLPEVREQQADLARTHGIEAFMYWHYWFAGQRVLERIFDEVLASGRPDFPFCLGWANQTWSGIWHGEPNRVLIEQTYPGREDYERHFVDVLPALRDPRYLRVDGRPVFVVFRPTELPDAQAFTALWRDLADQHGLEGLHLIGFDHMDGFDPRPAGFDAAILSRLSLMFGSRRHDPLFHAKRNAVRFRVGRAALRRANTMVQVFDYERVAAAQIPEEHPDFEAYPAIITNWDNTPRSGRNGSVLRNHKPEALIRQIQAGRRFLQPLPHQHRLLFLKSWNEWAEGNYLEPDAASGPALLEATAQALDVTAEPVEPVAPAGLGS